MKEKVKLRVVPVVGTDKKLYRYAYLMPGVKYEDLTVEDLIEAEKTFQEFLRDE